MSPRICVLASGGGRSVENLCEQIKAGQLDVEIAMIISDKPGAGVLQRAEDWKIESQVIQRAKGQSAAEHSALVFEAIEAAGDIELVVLAGYLKLLMIPSAWSGKALNIHPSLLPAFGGKGYFGDHVHRAVLDRGVEVTGCTVHYVDDEYDHGKVLHQRWIPVPKDADVDSLAGAVFEQEQQALPEAIRRHFAS